MVLEVVSDNQKVKPLSTNGPCSAPLRQSPTQRAESDLRSQAWSSSSVATPPASWAAASRRRREGLPTDGATLLARPSGASRHNSTWARGCSRPSTPNPVTNVAQSSIVRAAFFTDR